MAFTVPQFPIDIVIWHNYDPAVSSYGLPDGTSLANLSPGKRTFSVWQDVQPTDTVFRFPMEVLVPPLTDLRAWYDDGAGVKPDLVECPKSSTRFYIVYYVDDIAKGFANEHRFAMLQMVRGATTFVDTGPIPFPIPLP